MLERLRRQRCALGQRETAPRNGGEHVLVARRIDDDCDGWVILGSRAHHRRATDVDLLDAFVRGGAAGDGVGERIQVDDHQLERLHAQFFELLEMLGPTGIGADTGVHPRMQCLDPAVESFGESGEILDLGDGNARVGDLRSGRSGGHQGHACVVQAGRQLDQSGLVVDTDQRAAHCFTFGHG